MGKRLEEYFRFCCVLAISGAFVACSSSTGGNNAITSEEQVRPVISNITFCFRTGDPLTVYGTEFLSNSNTTHTVAAMKVFICDSPKWGDRTICENQKYSSWTENVIKLSVTMGNFEPGTTGYIYVVDDTGDINPNGYPVVFCGT